MSERKQISIAWYAVTDFITASLAWGLYFFIRKAMLQFSIVDADFKHSIELILKDKH